MLVAPTFVAPFAMKVWVFAPCVTTIESLFAMFPATPAGIGIEVWLVPLNPVVRVCATGAVQSPFEFST